MRNNGRKGHPGKEAVGGQSQRCSCWDKAIKADSNMDNDI